MDTKKILSALTSAFRINLGIVEEKLPDSVKIIVRPLDFEERKGIAVISTIEWLSLKTHLAFDSFLGKLLDSIMSSHKEKVNIMVYTLKNMIDKSPSEKLSAEIDHKLLTNVNENIDLKKLSIFVDRPTMDLGIKSIEEYVIEQQKLILGIILLLFDIEEEDASFINEVEGLPEGGRIRIEVNKYERSRLNRQACLNFYGYSCSACGFNFENVYGPLGKDYIHVHHIIPVSLIGDDYLINPIKDLIPICPNCHAILHRLNPPMQIKDLKDTINHRGMNY
jgi:5-methylcytosine-specific restriction protein A